MIIDSHVHLWKTQHGRVDGRPVRSLTGGRSDFGGEVRQMTPPYLLNGENTAEMLVANMDYAGVSAAVVTQEEIDGNQDAWLLAAKEKFPERLQICSLYEEGRPFTLNGFDGVKLCAGRFPTQDLTKHAAVFEEANNAGKFVHVELADGDRQTGALAELIQQFPDLRIVIGHFGMVTRDGWQAQIRLARAENVRVESGGITWLFHREFYPYPSAIRAVKEAADLCGMEKLMWGSDYPRTMTAITYRMSFDFVQKTDELNEEEKAAFLFENAASFYGFSDLTEPVRIRNMVED